MYVNNLIIEVTRRCNMACQHCLRGDQENINLDKAHITALLEQVEYAGSITFTGGEPSLYVDAISFTLEECERLGVDVGSFYIATNGLSIKEDFILACLRWYSYCSEKEMCRVDCSNDGFHAEEGSYNTELLGGLSFFGRKYQEEGRWMNGDNGMINEGYYLDNYGDGRKNTASDIETVEDLNDAEVYLNCKGDIINGCDWSYESQESQILCPVDGLAAFVASLPES